MSILQIIKKSYKNLIKVIKNCSNKEQKNEDDWFFSS